jgi:hypothetical protein
MKKITLALLAAAAMAACSPTYNWRDYASPDASFHAMFPDKPASFTRNVDLDGVKVDMTMTAAEVEGALFAVGTAQVPDAAKAPAAMTAMKIALVRNIGGAITSEKTHGAGIDVEAAGSQDGRPVKLTGHFEARGKRVYQVVVMSRGAPAPAEQVEQFLTSFKAQ